MTGKLFDKMGTYEVGALLKAQKVLGLINLLRNGFQKIQENLSGEKPHKFFEENQ